MSNTPNLSMSIPEQLKQAHTDLLRAGARMANLIQQLEGELERMKAKGVNQEFIDAKDSQIEELVKYHNQVDELFSFYKLITLNYRMQLTEACQVIIKMSKDDVQQTEWLKTYLQQTGKANG